MHEYEVNIRMLIKDFKKIIVYKRVHYTSCGIIVTLDVTICIQQFIPMKKILYNCIQVYMNYIQLERVDA